MRPNYKIKYPIALLAPTASILILMLFYFVYKTVPRYNPNVFLEFKFVSKDYYKILINDSLIIDSNEIKNMKYSNDFYQTKTLHLELNKGNYHIQIKNSKEEILSESPLEIDSLQPKYVYLGREITIRNEPFMLL